MNLFLQPSHVFFPFSLMAEYPFEKEILPESRCLPKENGKVLQECINTINCGTRVVGCGNGNASHLFALALALSYVAIFLNF